MELTITRRRFNDPQRLVEAVSKRVEEIRGSGGRIGYITFVPNGEPTLDIDLGVEARALRELGIPLAILTNGSLLYRGDVRNDLMVFDYVSVKVDAVSERLWRIINRPHPGLEIDQVLEGLITFRKNYRGRLVTETMLLGNISYDGELEKIASHLRKLNPDTAYIAIPTRPPAEKWVKPPSEELLNKAYQIFSEKVSHVELLIGFEGKDFTVLDDLSREILSITSVHPLREDVLENMLSRRNQPWSIVEKLVRKGMLKKVQYMGYTYYIRRLRRKQRQPRP